MTALECPLCGRTIEPGTDEEVAAHARLYGHTDRQALCWAKENLPGFYWAVICIRVVLVVGVAGAVLYFTGIVP